MSELKLTNEKMKTYDDEQNKGAFKTAARLESFGENQNSVNELLAANINELIKRVCALEDERDRHRDIMRTLAKELNDMKKTVDRLKVTSKLNTNAIKRMDDKSGQKQEGDDEACAQEGSAAIPQENTEE